MDKKEIKLVYFPCPTTCPNYIKRIFDEEAKKQCEKCEK